MGNHIAEESNTGICTNMPSEKWVTPLRYYLFRVTDEEKEHSLVDTELSTRFCKQFQ